MRSSCLCSGSLLLLVLQAFACSSSDPNDNSDDPGSGGESGGSGSGSGGATDGSGGTIVIDAGVEPQQPTTDVSVAITADNAYGFGYGSERTLVNYFGNVENTTAGGIFNCPPSGVELYTVPAAEANAGSYLYIVSYADHSVTQGVLGSFVREGGEPVFTGEGAWEVCATGQDFDLYSGGPSLQEINLHIGRCNQGLGDPATTSVGWVDLVGTAQGRLAVGETNDSPRDSTPGNHFPEVCGINEQARWMWFDWAPATSDPSYSPFEWPGGSGNVTKDFLIFRLGAEEVPEAPR